MGLIKKIWSSLIGAPEPKQPNTMLLVDARSGQTWNVPDSAPSLFDAKSTPRVDYPDGEFIEVLAFEPGLTRARALLRWCVHDYSREDASGSHLVTTEKWTELQVRWFHPSFPFQHVAFIPS